MMPDIHAAHLFVPAVRPDFLNTALASGASAVIVDLEDSVPPDSKEEARRALPTLIDPLLERGVVACVRVNHESELLGKDLEAAVAAGAQHVVLPKVEDPAWIQDVCHVLALAEHRSGRSDAVRLELQVETARGLARVEDLAAADSRIVSVMLGVEDFSTDLNIDPDHPDADLSWAHARILLAANVVGLVPYGTLSRFTEFRDLDSYAVSARRSRAFGYLGAYCIHPAQVSVAVKEFSPTSEQLEHASAVVQTYETAERAGRSAVAMDGQMIDRPVAERARRLLAAHPPTPSTERSNT